MKKPLSNPQNQSQKQKQNQNQDPQMPQYQLSHYDIKTQQIQSALLAIQKIKRIQKDRMTALKQKYKKLNKLFASMSQFFVTNKRKINIQKKKQKAKRILQRKQRMLKKLQNVELGIPKQQLFKTEQVGSQNCGYPQIIQENSERQQSTSSYTKPKICYICSKAYAVQDDIYNKHCPACAAFSKTKRFQTANLTGKIALVTGARIKIGYQITIKLLRDNATVYATTRFTNDALIRYQKQPDYQNFKGRLFLIQCDFLSAPQVQSLINYMKQNVSHLDILIHNAAQTLTRPTQFYTFQLQNQQKQLQYDSKLMIKFQNHSHPSLQNTTIFAINSQDKQQCQIDLQNTDQFGQPLDLRPTNTWKQKIQNVSLMDCLSTQIINSTVPFYITGQLRCIMGGQTPSFVINVSSMQGVFYRKAKTHYHPHTNMAKASLNMITRTCAHQFAAHNIYMNSVDTGWVTNQNPFCTAIKMKIKHDFDPPLDCIQGAMRVIDPIYQAITSGKYIYGKFLKNYEQSFW